MDLFNLCEFEFIELLWCVDCFPSVWESAIISVLFSSLFHGTFMYMCVCICVWVCVFVYVYKCMYTNMFGGFPKVSENGLFFLTYYSVSQIFCLSHWYKVCWFFLLSAQICCLFFIVNFQLLLYILIQNLSF